MMPKTVVKIECVNCQRKTPDPLCEKCLPVVEKAFTLLPNALDLALDLMAHPAPTNSERPSSSHPGISLDPSLLVWRTYATRLQVRMHKWVKTNHGLIDPGDTFPYMLAHLDEWVTQPGAHKWVGEAIGLYASATKWAGD
jgi:hypothetical protein